MAALVAFDTAKTHLRVTDDDHDAEIQTKLDHASAVIVDYLGDRADPLWDDTSTPLHVQAAVLYLLGCVYEHRGDDLAPDAVDEEAWAAVARLLARSRTPALA